MIVPGGGLSSDGSRWIATKPNFLLPFLVLSKLFRRLMLEKLTAARAAGKFRFFGAHANLADQNAFATFPAPLQKRPGGSSIPSCPSPVFGPCWRIYRATPIASPSPTAVSSQPMPTGVRVKDYREGPGRYTTMTLEVVEFIRRFLLRVLLKCFHRLRHYDLLADTSQSRNNRQGSQHPHHRRKSRHRRDR